jgi:thiol-disulfide isomerase/thioredoxin
MKIGIKFSLFLLTLLILAMVFFNLGEASAANSVPIQSEVQLVAEQNKLPVYFFWGDGCPHCHDEKIFLQSIENNYPQISFYSFEVYNNPTNYQLLLQMSREKTGQIARGVPYLIIGDEVVEGFGGTDTTGIEIKQFLDIYTSQGNNQTNSENGEGGVVMEEKIKYPIWGEVNLKKLSLPLLTTVLGTLDGFNPCSMWALVVLITLLINTGSKKKMWLVGGTFILASAIAYFLFLTAWLNAFLLVGYLMVVRIIIGILAVGVGIYFIRDYIKKRKQDALTCEVTGSETKSKLITRLERILEKKSVWAVMIGVIAIAFSVNLIELMCSAGIPAIYTKILAQNNLPKVGYYLYLLAYDFFYMLDDMVVLLIAGLTWQLLIKTGKYVRYSHLIGGVLLLILGAIMLIDPKLLMFK